MEGGVTVLPTEDLDLLLELKVAWEAWAKALVAAGRWRPFFTPGIDKEELQQEGGQ